MTAQEKALQDKLPVIQVIPKDKRKYPSMPMDTYLQEAVYLFKWCQPDKPRLVKAGLDWVWVTDLPVRTDATREAQSIWHNVRFGREEALKKWLKISPEGYALRDDILHEMYYAFRKLPDLHTRVDAVAEGSGDADMIQDLSDLTVIGRENLPPLVAVGFEPPTLDKAAKMCQLLANLRADASVDKEEDKKKKQLRDQAYTHLKEAVDEIRECGQHVFWKEEERAKGYASAYHRRIRKEAEARAKAKAEAQPTE